MAFKNTLLSRLLNRERKKENTKHQTAQTEQDAAQTAEELAQETEQTRELKLSPEHPLNLLWNFHNQKSASAFPEPLFVFDPFPKPGEDDMESFYNLFTDDYVAYELSRLDRNASGMAERRLKELTADENIFDLDAKVQVFTTEDKLTAWIFIFPPYGNGKDVTNEMILKALDMSRIKYGINEQFLKLPKFEYFGLYFAAFGIPPLNGKDGYIIDLFSRNHVQAFSEDESGKVDYASLETFQTITKGEIICRIAPPTEHEDGRKVTDEIAYAHVGKPAVFPKGRNTEISEEGDALIASIDGHVEFSGRNFQVKPVLEIGGNVDFSTGNINCLGDIHIRGDITSGFTVRATGNITVDGVIEACIVEAGTDLVVRKGVQGNNKAILRAHRSIFAKYIESSRVYVRENLETECIVNCEVYSDGKVTVRTGRGTIIGGEVRAAQEVSANIVGARSECFTSIVLGGRPCEEFERKNLDREIGELETELKKIERQPDSPAKLRQMSKLRMQVSANKLKLQQFDKALEKLGEDPDPGRGRLVCSTVYPGSEVTISGSSMRVDRENRMCIFSLVAGEVLLH